MGIGFVLIFWLMVSSLVGLVIGVIVGVFANSAKTGTITAFSIFVLIPSVFMAPYFYVNLPRSADYHWQQEFGAPPDKGFVFTDVNASFSTDFYGRVFWLNVDTDALETFAADNGFELTLKDLQNDGRKKGSDGWGKTKFSGACESVYFYVNDKHFQYQDSDYNKPEAWIRHCPQTGETQVLIVDVD